MNSKAGVVVGGPLRRLRKGSGVRRPTSHGSVLAGGRSWAGRGVLSLLAGGDCIDDVEVLRAGATSRVLGHRVMAASTVGTFLRSFTFGRVRQLDQLAEAALTRAWKAGAGPGDRTLVVDADSTICQVYGPSPPSCRTHQA